MATKNPKRRTARSTRPPSKAADWSPITAEQWRAIPGMSQPQLQALCGRVFGKTWSEMNYGEHVSVMAALRSLAPKAPKGRVKELHLLSKTSITEAACGASLAELPPGTVATFVTGVTCIRCKKTPAYAAAMRAWNEGGPEVPRVRRAVPGAFEEETPAPALERDVVLLLEHIEDVVARASLAAMRARADSRPPARELVKVLEALQHSLGAGSMSVTALQLFLQLVSPRPAFAEEVAHEQ